MMAPVSHLRPEYKDHVWSYDLMMARTVEGRAFRILTIIDEYTRECLAILTQRRITSEDVIEQLFCLFMFRGTPDAYSHLIMARNSPPRQCAVG